MVILLVEDDDAVLGTIGEFLSDSGYGVVYARDGREAALVLEECDGIDLVISDVCMPLMGGLELLQLIRRRVLGVPVILMTGYGNEETAVRAFQGGVLDYVKKPVRLTEVHAMVKRHEECCRFEAELLAEGRAATRERRAEVDTALAEMGQLSSRAADSLDGLVDASRRVHACLMAPMKADAWGESGDVGALLPWSRSWRRSRWAPSRTTLGREDSSACLLQESPA